MSDLPVLLAIVTAWLAIGIVLSLVLGHRGHDRFSWFVLGTLLGPLAIVLAIASWRTERSAAPHVLARGAGGTEPGSIDVLVGYDGSPESRACLTATIEVLGARLGRLTLATIVAFDGGWEAAKLAADALEQEAERLAWLAPGTEIILGNPAEALAARAAEGGYELLAIGTRGSDRGHHFGSAATALARAGKVPVLLVPAGLGS